MLLINVHKLDIILAQPVAFTAFKHQVDNIWGVVCLERQDVFILGASKHFHKGAQVDAEGNVAIAAEGGEGFGFEHHGDKGNV